MIRNHEGTYGFKNVKFKAQGGDEFDFTLGSINELGTRWNIIPIPSGKVFKTTWLKMYATSGLNSSTSNVIEMLELYGTP